MAIYSWPHDGSDEDRGAVCLSIACCLLPGGLQDQTLQYGGIEASTTSNMATSSPVAYCAHDPLPC